MVQIVGADGRCERANSPLMCLIVGNLMSPLRRLSPSVIYGKSIDLVQPGHHQFTCFTYQTQVFTLGLRAIANLQHCAKSLLTSRSHVLGRFFKDNDCNRRHRQQFLMHEVPSTDSENILGNSQCE